MNHGINPLKKSEESFRVSISNWTELNVWEYIKENIEIVHILQKKEKSLLAMNKSFYLMTKISTQKGDNVEELEVRFRTLGCYPLTAGVKAMQKMLKILLKN